MLIFVEFKNVGDINYLRHGWYGGNPGQIYSAKTIKTS